MVERVFDVELAEAELAENVTVMLFGVDAPELVGEELNLPPFPPRRLRGETGGVHCSIEIFPGVDPGDDFFEGFHQNVMVTWRILPSAIAWGR
jgi:hypothetical protein